MRTRALIDRESIAVATRERGSDFPLLAPRGLHEDNRCNGTLL